MNHDKKNQVKSIFSKNADAYATSITHANGEDLEQLIDWLQPSSCAVALDLATGGGNVVKRLAQTVATVFATDLTKEMLQNTSNFLTDYKNVYYVVADAENIPFLNNSFDIVSCRIAAHHFPNPALFIEEVHRVLKPGGTFILIDNVAPAIPALDEFMNTFEEMRDPSHSKALTVKDWTELIERNQLEIVREQRTKKTLPFHNWVNRTAEDQSQVQAVTHFFKMAQDKEKQYFKFKEEKGRLQSFSIDQWMVMCKKKSSS